MVKYVRIRNEEIVGIDVTLPVVFTLGNEQFTSFLNGRIDMLNRRQLKGNESVEER